VHLVGDGLVDELAGDLLSAVDDAQTLVALGGGRVVDTAKALAAARPAATAPRVAAIPTTLSAAEMTRLHRQACGGPADRHVRPALVLNDPALSASQPAAGLAASSANALSHALEAQASALASPVPSLAGREAAVLLREAWAQDPAEPDRDALALGALLSGYAIDGAWYGLHHVLAQTLVRVGGVGHGAANAVLLPHTLAALTQRTPELDADGAWRALARRLAERAGAPTLTALGIDDATIEACADAAAQRSELANTPPTADRTELSAIYEAAR
jgi:alcohol dehydrogenase class IV